MTDVNLGFLVAFASQHRLPAATVQELAASVAEQCALIANRYEPSGELESVDLGIAEALGAEIGAAILAAFQLPEATMPLTKHRMAFGGSSQT